MDNPYRSAAIQILNTMRNIVRTQHVYQEVDSTKYKNISHRFYSRTQKSLERLGFRKIADIEDVTLRSINHTNPTFIRLMGNLDLKINAAIFEVSTSLFMKVLSFLRKFKLKIYEFNTHFSNDLIIETTIASQKIQNIKIDTIRFQYGGNRSVEDLFKMHKSRHLDILNKLKDPGYCYSDSIDTFIENERRTFELKKTAYEKKAGFLKNIYSIRLVKTRSLPS